MCLDFMDMALEINMKVFIVVGSFEYYGAHGFKKEIVKVFKSNEDAIKFIEKSKVPVKSKSNRGNFYKGGYYDLEIESHHIEI